jgi:transposase-like protein
MGVQAVKQSLRIQEWATQISDRKQSGMTVTEWCKEQGYSAKTYYYRLKRIREELLEASESRNQVILQDKPVFAALPMPKAECAAVRISLGSCIIEIRNGADGAIIGQVLKTVSRL